MIRGINILFSLNGNVVAFASEADINIETSFLGHSAQATTKGRNYLAQVVGFSMNISGELDFLNRKFLYTFLEGFTLLDFQYHTATATDGKFTGKCWVQNYGEQSPSNSFARYNMSFLGEGKPEFEPEI